MRRLLFPILFLATAGAAMADDPAPPPAGKITIEQATRLATALRNLDGHMVVVKQKGPDGTSADNVVMTPWEFGSGSLRARIANDLTIVAAVEKSADEARQAIVREIVKRAGGTEIKAGTPEREDFDRQYADLLKQPAPGSQDLARIKASELKLDRNEIPGTVLSALSPILDFDVK